MVRTRAAAHEASPDPVVRRNPSRSTPRQAGRPSTAPSKASSSSRKNVKGSLAAGASDFSDSSIPDDGTATESGQNTDVESGSDTQIAYRLRRLDRSHKTTNAIPSEGSRRSSRQAASSRLRHEGPSVPDTSACERHHPQTTTKRRKSYQNKATPPKKRRSLPQQENEPVPVPDGIIPNWQDPQMPYGAWTDIFYYAATAAGGQDSLDVNWLISAATTCKAFSEAAITAIYRRPPISTPGKARRLATLLETAPSQTRFNYRAKIESLYVDIQVVPQAVLPKLIHPLPRLRELVLFTQSDQPPYRQLNRTVRWHYPDEIFQALGPSSALVEPTEGKSYHTLLKSWEWSGSLLGGPVATIKDIARVHLQASFSHLTKLSFTNFQVPSLYKPRLKPGDEEGELLLYSEDGAVIESIAEAISQVPSLKHLIFESSTVMNDRLLPLLPKDLIHLGLINCWEVKSDDLASFLHTHGTGLRTLTLSHNQSLDLAFLTSLADTCPKLEELYMNLSYFRHHDSLSFLNNDADPLYDQALYPHQIPKWPCNIRVIDIEHIRHWSLETAEMFLQSLIDSAGSLPNLRHLTVKTMLNIPWKARANMRHEWRRKLDRVFLRPFEPPKRYVSLRQTQIGEPLQESPRKNRKKDLDEPSRRSNRIASQQFSDSDSRQSSISKGLRSFQGRPKYADPETDEDEFDESEEEGINEENNDESLSTPNGDLASVESSDEYSKIPPIQGLCTTVFVVFDNQKPTELQYGMEDFMDEDCAESDDEWDGDHEEDDDAVLAWR